MAEPGVPSCRWLRFNADRSTSEDPDAVAITSGLPPAFATLTTTGRYDHDALSENLELIRTIQARRAVGDLHAPSLHAHRGRLHGTAALNGFGRRQLRSRSPAGGPASSSVLASSCR